MLRCIAALIALFCGTVTASAEDPIRFPRTPDLSPDGKLVAFSHRGDIWTVPVEGGLARPITQHEAHDIYPAFSPDGKWIAFSSNRFGGYDVFVVPVQGGRPTRLTFDSNPDVVRGWTADGKDILFRSSREVSFPSGSDIYRIPMTGGAETRLPVRDAKSIAIAADGTLAFTRGAGDSYRKGYRGSADDDIWIAGPNGVNPRPLTSFDGQDSNPLWAPNGRALYYVSEKFGTPANLVVQPMQPGADGITAVGEPTALTMHKDDAVREARIGANGAAIIYECGTDLYLVNTADRKSRKLAIYAYADDKSNVEKTTAFSRDISQYELSPDEKSVAFVVHGEIFLGSINSGAPAKRLTEWAGNDSQISWAPDGKSILFVSDRGVQDDLYVLTADPAGPLIDAKKFAVKRLTNSPEPEEAASFSPDGKRIVFIRDGKLLGMNADGTDLKPIVDRPQVSEYEWSPDGKSMVIGRADGSFGSELYLVASTGGAMTNLTRYATQNSSVTWSKTGQRLAFMSERRKAQRGLYVMNLQRPGADGASGNDLDLEDVHLRVALVTSQTVGTAAINPDGQRVVYTASSPTPGGADEDDLWIATVEGRLMTRLTTGNQGPRSLRFARGGAIVFFLNRVGELRFVLIGGSGGGVRGPAGAVAGGASPAMQAPTPTPAPTPVIATAEPGRVPLVARLTVNSQVEFQAAFDQAWRVLADGFYDPTFHGTNWQAVRDKLRPALAQITEVEDFYALVNIMLGELNASHLGISGRGREVAPEDMTADLGLLFDGNFAGPGLRIAEVIRRGPADRRGIKLTAGEVITHLDDVELGPTVNVSKLLNGKAGSSIALKVVDPMKPKEAARIEKVTAVTRATMSPLMYQRWVRHNAEMVTKLSKGTLGYIHIPSMDDEGLETFVRALYSDNFDKEAIVLDVRYNGGGFTHDQVLNYLTGKPHTLFRSRTGNEGTVMRNFDRKWNRPLILLTNSRSYSDAEIFPHAFRTLGLGKIVGTPTGGHVIGTVQRRLLDGSRFRLPRLGVYTFNGVNLEKEAVQPDIRIEMTSEDNVAGRDPQIAKAVELLLIDAAKWKQANPSPSQPMPRPVTITPTITPMSAPVGGIVNPVK